MLTIDNIYNYWRTGGARPIQAYISDAEMEEILCHELLDKYAPYTLISVIRENTGEDFIYHHMESSIDEFMKLRNVGADRFYLRSKSLTPDLSLPDNPLTDNSLSHDYMYCYSYNGLLKIYQGKLTAYKYVDESVIAIIEKYAYVGTPEEREVYLNKEYLEEYYNKEYLEIFNKIKKSIKKRLKYRTVSKNTGLPAKHPNVTEGFAKAMREGAIDTGSMEIVE